MRNVLLAFTVFAILLGCYAVWMRTHSPVLSMESSSGQAAIGGGFTLTDQNGKKVKDEQFRGKWMLVFFGFSHCPGECPLALSNMTGALDMLGADAKNVVPVFISVDPVNDTPKALKKYAANFHKSLVALTGTKEELKTVADGYKVFSSQDKDLKINHSAFIYLMNPKGEYVKHFANSTSDAVLAEAVRSTMEKSNN